MCAPGDPDPGASAEFPPRRRSVVHGGQTPTRNGDRLVSFLLPCPNCGPRDVNEFAYQGEVTVRPTGSPALRDLGAYLYFRKNVAGVQREWWYHRLGCELWFQAERDTRTNEVLKTEVPRPSAAGIPDSNQAPQTMPAGEPPVT